MIIKIQESLEANPQPRAETGVEDIGHREDVPDQEVINEEQAVVMTTAQQLVSQPASPLSLLS